ncbi:hypothetical protein HZB60_04170 [candidate division KSB1 bacterium]|nr:hypothetical protein [candidate division KSB1 bacterium]
MSIIVRSFGGRGPVRMSVRGLNSYTPMWNAQKFDLATETAEDKLLNAMSAAGGIIDSMTMVTGASVGINSPDYHPDSIAQVLLGKNVSAVAGTATAEAHTVAAQGTVVKLDKIPLAVSAVKDGTGAATYVLGTDYNVTAAGIEVITGGGIAAASVIKVDYSTPAVDVVHALTDVGAEFSMLFEGVNTQSKKNVIIEIFRCRFTAAKQLSFLSADTKFGHYDFTANILADESRPAGESQYFKITYVN